jgi:MFS family permease
VKAGRSIIVVGIVVAASVTALTAVGILLFGGFGTTEARILTTTALIAAYGLLALPIGFLIDQGGHRAFARAALLVPVAGFAASVATLWTDDAPAALGNATLTLTALAIACAQTAALVARLSPDAAPSVRRLLAVATGLGFLAAGMLAVAAWAGIEQGGYFRVLGAVAVLDVLAVVLHVVLARSRRRVTTYWARITVDRDEVVETTVHAADLATAAAKAIRSAERSGHQATGLTIQVESGWSTAPAYERPGESPDREAARQRTGIGRRLSAANVR